jgi:SAM-dependent methyltransferase
MTGTQEEINRAVYRAPRITRFYYSEVLQPSEAACLLRYQPRIAGHDVLDIGAGTGRTARYLAPLASRYEAIDYSPVMIRYLRRAMPDVKVHEADFQDLTAIPDTSFDFVFAADNVIDALSHEGRLRALGEARRVLRPGGLLAFSAHNLRYKRALAGPRIDWSSNPVRLAANVAIYALGMWNHVRVARLRRVMPEYAILNDRGHFYACLHYYAARATVDRQLAQSGLQLLEVYDCHGRVLHENQDDGENPSLLYAAERLA